jgi:hypothetical protein
MKKINLLALSVFLMFVVSLKAASPEIIKKKGYTLTFESNDPALDLPLSKGLSKPSLRYTRSWRSNTTKKQAVR